MVTRSSTLTERDAPVEQCETDTEDAPMIALSEMLDELHVGEDATGGEGAEMAEWTRQSKSNG